MRYSTHTLSIVKPHLDRISTTILSNAYTEMSMYFNVENTSLPITQISPNIALG